MVPPEGFEPSTSRSGGARSNPLSYEGNGCASLARDAAGLRVRAALRRRRAAGPCGPRAGLSTRCPIASASSTSRARDAAGARACSGAA